MKILVVGGGSGGHITPAVAVVREILARRPRANIEFWTDKKYYKNVVKITTEIGMNWGRTDEGNAKKVPYIRVRKVLAGKYHRYSGWSFTDYFKYWDVTLKDLIWGNIKGFCGFVGGLVQSFCRLVRRGSRPDVIFLKGGFVGLPVGMVARFLKIPYVIHESDTVPGLANRLLMRRAKVVAMGMPFDATKAPENWRWVGTPVAPEYKKVTVERQKSLKKVFGFDPERPLVIITGGSQGAANINAAMREILPEMLKFTSVGLQVGRSHYDEMVEIKKKYEIWDEAKLKSNFRMWQFCSTMDELLGSADVVVSRAGATTIAEVAALGKAMILVPYERLPGSHQVRNADSLGKAGAAVVIYDSKVEKKPELLLEEVRHLVRSPKEREKLAEELHKNAKTEAAGELAEIILELV